LHKLRWAYYRTRDDVKSKPALFPTGTLWARIPKGSSKDFGSDERIQFEDFLTYIQIVGYLFPEHFATTLAMI
jgi:hypothetical protein